MNPKLKLFLIPRAASGFLRLLHFSLRVRHVHVDRIEDLNKQGKNFLMAFWHRHLLLMVFARFRKPMVPMISLHKDGEYMARTMERFGCSAARGSSTRGGSAALRGMIDSAVERGCNLAITPDGPRGPALVAQKGVVFAAQRAGCPVVPVALISERKKVLRSWDSFEIPKPLSRAMFIYGEPIHVPAELDVEGVEAWRLKIETAMRALTESAERDFDTLWRSGVR